MAETVLMSIEGILSKDGPPNGQPIVTGLRLFHALRSQFKVLLSTLCVEQDWIDHWLNVVGIKETHYLGNADPECDDYEVRMRHFLEARRSGYELTLVFDSNPQVCAEIMRQGVTAVVFAHPRYSRPEARPDYANPIKPWDEFERAVTAERVKVPRKLPIDAEMGAAADD